jgi:hypothetical protein
VSFDFLVKLIDGCGRLLLHCTNLSFAMKIRLVEETLQPLDPDRRAFRLVGGVLVRKL